ncbi:MAG: hypothetical protein KAI79_16505 [Bacteroidales bacterium]|nr:hypothetical protein [Bacteroidales bacterium]
MKLKLILFFLFLSTFSYSQSFDLKEAEHYKNLAPKYELWLQQTGIDEYLKIDGTDTDGGKLSLYLVFKFAGNDSARVAWDTLKTQFVSKHNFSLEEQLYRSMISIMRVNPNFANLQIYSIDKNGETGCFYRGIYYNAEQKKVEWEEENCMASMPKNIDLGADELKGADLLKFVNKNNTIVDHAAMQKLVYAKIVAFAKIEFENKISKPSDFYHDKTQKSILYFEVKNLRAEVFENETNSFISESINWFSDITGFSETKSDWRTIEELHFYIRYINSSDNKSFTIEIDIKGHYGSGFHDIMQWKQMYDMEKDFDPELLDYQSKFANKVYELIIPEE